MHRSSHRGVRTPVGISDFGHGKAGSGPELIVGCRSCVESWDTWGLSRRSMSYWPD
ncbi:hypothetical protein SAM23877_4534 [Streptomyces ambofaciens ATCC 23877]|uniref:Uncharacterized protein n=1 Tax=Streptomyces ambofaciens (strain ATCC 23877 / 3486 / DSM 40053 / JCM 4204 / NBRC 12836 / NRRL B-2516) TaxID=278992 RepID=A0A0K2AX37_STRA7|nr:hypothetical protein SAM23877_4534 [Streptomyces ambofaciens ATCC 23877]